ncbi:hypothetical protein BN1051_03059 [Arthrobacter saudimassiliensis]|uniref:Uncharacterized protein n=1 Tax=Arthrobacter saudimassiliensis TaxID=1461584 RepID=A0A078MW87_9MICC|nr:hypothetical protein BN1051_03059 [Arthrobacter saudimassiliensis]
MSSLLSRLELPAEALDTAEQSAKDLLAGLSGVAAVATASDPQWLRVTNESYARLQELAGFNVPKDGLIAGVVRGDKGRIDQFLKFDSFSGANPLMMSNAATLAATMALRSAIADLQSLVETMDVKLDVLLEDNRIEALGDIQGLTSVLTRACAIYDATGVVSETVWAQIAGHSSALARSEAKARGQVDALRAAVSARSFADRVDAVQRASTNEMQRWLVILAAIHVDQQRLDLLELAHLRQHSPEAVAGHAEENRKALQKRRQAVTESVQGLADALSAAADVSDANRVRSPLKARQLLQSAEQALGMIAAFAEVTGLEVVAGGEVERETWRKSVSDLVSEARSNVVAVPKILNSRREENLLRKASKVQAKRSALVKPESPGELEHGSTSKQESD